MSSMSRSSRAKALGALAGALLLTACAGGNAAPASSSASDEVISVKVGVIPVAETAGVYIAQDQGFFAEEGLDVETQVIQNAASIAPSVINGQLQFGTAAGAPFLAAVAKGLPLTAVANGSSVSSDAAKDPSAILAMPASRIERARDLAGKTVAVNALGSVSHVTAAGAIKKDGGDPAQTTFVVMPFPDMIAALERGAVDAAAVVEPFQALGAANGAVAISRPNSQTLTPGTFTLLFTSQQFAQQNPGTVAKFARAMDKASRAAAEDPSLVAAVLEKNANFDPALFEKMQLPVYTDDLNSGALQNMADLMRDLGFLQGDLDVSKAIWKGNAQ